MNMTINELGSILSEMYFNAPKNDAVVMIHLFGIKYAKEITDNNYSKKEIARIAKIPKSYVTEINKGTRLAEYVVPKNLI